LVLGGDLVCGCGGGCGVDLQVLDNNQLDQTLDLEGLSGLRVLSLNNNNITELHPLIKELRTNCPHLAFLSMMRNTACPECPLELMAGDSPDNFVCR
jgi:hypothetical protein